jgi:hypothetical protein
MKTQPKDETDGPPRAVETEHSEHLSLPEGLSEEIAARAHRAVLDWEDDTDRLAIELVFRLYRIFSAEEAHLPSRQ